MVGIFLTAWSGAAVYSTVDPVWATPLNTLLLLLTAIVGVLINRKVKAVEEKQKEHIAATDNAASAAASAAAAAAESARITKEIGGALRHVDPLTTDATSTTDKGV